MIDKLDGDAIKIKLAKIGVDKQYDYKYIMDIHKFHPNKSFGVL